jgi:hypothetical protein
VQRDEIACGYISIDERLELREKIRLASIIMLDGDCVRGAFAFETNPLRPSTFVNYHSEPARADVSNFAFLIRRWLSRN